MNNPTSSYPAVSESIASKIDRFRGMKENFQIAMVGAAVVSAVTWGIGHVIDQHFVTVATKAAAVRHDGFGELHSGSSLGGIAPVLHLGRCSIELEAEPKVINGDVDESSLWSPTPVEDVRDYIVELPGPGYVTVKVQNAAEMRAARPDLAHC